MRMYHTRHTVASIPPGQFFEVGGRRLPGLTFYKFEREACPEYFVGSESLWAVGVIADEAREEGRHILKILLTPFFIGPAHLGFVAWIVHPRAFVPAGRKIHLALKQRGILLKVDRKELALPQPKAGLRLLRPNGDGVTLRL